MLQNWDVNNVSNGRTMLHKACDFGHLDIVEYLIQNGADINVSYNIVIIILLLLFRYPCIPPLNLMLHYLNWSRWLDYRPIGGFYIHRAFREKLKGWKLIVMATTLSFAQFCMCIHSCYEPLKYY